MPREELKRIMSGLGVEAKIVNGEEVYEAKYLNFHYESGKINVLGHIPLSVASKIHSKSLHDEIKIKNNHDNLEPLDLIVYTTFKRALILHEEGKLKTDIKKLKKSIFNKINDMALENPDDLYVEDYELGSVEALLILLEEFYKQPYKENCENFIKTIKKSNN